MTYDFDVFLKRQFFWLTFGTLVAPPISKVEAIPVEATMTFFSWPWRTVMMLLLRKLLPVPPGPSRK